MLQELMPIYSKDGTCQTIKEYVEHHDDVEIDGIKQDIEDLKVDKVDKVENAVEGDVAGLTASGNIFDTRISLYGEKTYDYAEVLTIKNALPVPAVDCKVEVKPIQAGSGTPSPENIRPISGTDEVEISDSRPNRYVDGTVTFKQALAWPMDNTESATTITGISANGNVVNGTPSTPYFWMHIPFKFEKGKTIYLSVSTTTPPLAIFRISNSDGTYKTDVSTNVVYTPTEDFNGFIDLGYDSTLFNNYKFGFGYTSTFDIDDYNKSAIVTTIIPLPSTLYGGEVRVDEGSADSEYGYIASYNGETLPGAWISDRDVYTGSNSPTIGAEVCYELATPTTFSFDPTDVELLEGTNVVRANTGDISMTVKYDRLADLEDRVTALENA